MKKLQQGDVLLKATARIPKTAKAVPPAKRGVVLAEGEVTGHAHVMNPKRCTMFQDTDGTRFLAVLAPVRIRHEEHKCFTVPKGNYKLDIVREVDPFSEEIRSVKD